MNFQKTFLSKFICHSHRKETHEPFDGHELDVLFAKAGLRNRKVYPIKRFIIGVGRKNLRDFRYP